MNTLYSPGCSSTPTLKKGTVDVGGGSEKNSKEVKGTEWFAHRKQLNALEHFSLENKRPASGGKSVKNQVIMSSMEMVSRKYPFTALSRAPCGACT